MGASGPSGRPDVPTSLEILLAKWQFSNKRKRGQCCLKTIITLLTERIFVKPRYA
jgi:hypothetical protein